MDSVPQITLRTKLQEFALKISEGVAIKLIVDLAVKVLKHWLGLPD